MLHSLDMPSFLAEDAVVGTPAAATTTSSNGVNLNGSRNSFQSRKSVDGPRTSYDPQSRRKSNGELMVNGVNHNANRNGPVESVTRQHLTNGHRTSEEKHSMENGGPVESVSRRSATSQEERESEKSRYPLNRLATRDDGHFASAGEAKVEEGIFSNHVILDAFSTDGMTPPTQHDTWGSNHERKSTTARSEKSPDDMESESESHQPPKDHHHHHRISSPPVLTSTTGQKLAPPRISKLQQRHTLEVPRISNPRLSKDSAHTADEVVNASGRFSPTTPTRRRGSLTLARRVTRSINSDLHLEESQQDQDTIAYSELVRQKRMSRRRRKEEEEEDRVLVGTKVDQNHVNYVMAYNMLTGIRFTVSRTNAKMDRDLTEADFAAKHKFSFDVTGAELTPSAKYDFKFKDYAPWVFRHLREIFGIDPADYLMSLTSKYILSELGSPGKSGSFFYFSRDYKYIIKTIHHAEHKVLRSMLKDYYNHVKSNPNTLLSQFYGLHRVKIPFGRKIHFVVMNNLFPLHRDIHRTYDLKGSTIGRLYKEDNLVENPRATLKDLNWLDKNSHLEFGPAKRHAFIQQMERDVELLQRMKIMDYSLLVGIHDLKRGNDEQIREKTLQVFHPGGDKEQEENNPASKVLTRTPSKLETARKAKELRQTLRLEKPVPMSQTGSKMPEEMEGDVKSHQFFYSDGGGFGASHEDNGPGDVIYYLGIIDCLTHYGFVKRIEHFWKSLSNDEKQISPIPPDRYGDRFVRFISGTTSSSKRVAEEKANCTTSALDNEETNDPSSPDKSNVSNAPVQRLSSQARRTDPEAFGASTATGITGQRSSIGAESDVMERAERSRERASQELEKDDARPPETRLTTARSPSAERGDPGGFTLPVVEESANEDRSTGGRSDGERDSSPYEKVR